MFTLAFGQFLALQTQLRSKLIPQRLDFCWVPNNWLSLPPRDRVLFLLAIDAIVVFFNR